MNGISSIHVVKYFVAMIMNLCPLDEVGDILPTRSNPHCEKGHGVVIGLNSCVGA